MYLKIMFILFAVAILGIASVFFGTTYRFYIGPSESELRATGFNKELFDKETNDQVSRFSPIFPFWSDGAKKNRYIYIPPGGKIDNSDPDRWNFPVGTRIWKEFIRDGVSVEIRMLYKTNVNPWDWDMAVYGPPDALGNAKKLMFGRSDVLGTEHDIPAPSTCVSCHGAGDQRRVLGLTAIQLPWDSDSQLSIQILSEHGKLTHEQDAPFLIPGNPIEKAALGYLDMNCGSCHYDGSSYVSEDIPIRLNLTTKTLSSVAQTNAFRTTVSKKLDGDYLGATAFIEPGNPDKSYIYRRMSIRDGGPWQMPPLATETVDATGVQLIENWIRELSLTHDKAD